MKLSEACEQYRGEIVAYLKKTFGIGDRAEDAAQHAFCQAALYLPHIREMPDEAVKAWLYATARNGAIDALRKDSRLAYDHDFDRQQQPRGLDEADRLALREAIEQLDELKQDFVHLRYYKDMNSTQIAQYRNVNASTVRYHLMKAIEQLKEQLKEGKS